MARFTLNDCAADLRRKYETCPDGVALRLVRDAYAKLCERFAVDVVSATVPLVAGQRRYALPDAWDGLRSVVYRPDADPDSAVELLGDDNLDDKDMEGTLWRYVAPDVPAECVLDGADFVLIPPSDVSTPAGEDKYPRLDVEATLTPSMTPAAPLPRTIRSTDVIVLRAATMWAADNDRAGFALQKALYDQAVLEFSNFARTRSARHKDQSYPESYGGDIV